MHQYGKEVATMQWSESHWARLVQQRQHILRGKCKSDCVTRSSDTRIHCWALPNEGAFWCGHVGFGAFYVGSYAQIETARQFHESDVTSVLLSIQCLNVK